MTSVQHRTTFENKQQSSPDDIAKQNANTSLKWGNSIPKTLTAPL